MFLTKIRSVLLALALAGALPSAAFAQDADDPRALEIAKEILDISRVTSGFNVILPEMAERTKITFTRSNPELALVISEVTDNVALSMVSKRVELQDRAAKIWASKFTKDELEDILEFYKTDAGSKFALEYSAVLRDTIALTNNWGEELAQELAAKVRVEMTLRGHQL